MKDHSVGSETGILVLPPSFSQKDLWILSLSGVLSDIFYGPDVVCEKELGVERHPYKFEASI